ncbi:sensor histidine kinase [Ketobacter sp.]|uniref:sensor histidine kinase n=1 Tax=Ketobacter sp. TaxID=2083498 RepID=UPI000F21B165|nr:HAMP domain-containing sensor histidine kinase [Ketobacter sp.]RLU00813.1 MAG: sensor histidine kinase [Ketobacter sp.]
MMQLPTSPLPGSGARYLLWYNGALTLIMTLAAWLMGLQGFQLPAAILWSAVAGQLLLTGLCTLFSAQLQSTTGMAFLVILLVSMFNLALYLFASGGHTNPVISLLLLPLALSAVSLRPWQTLLLALVVVLLYTLLTHYYQPLSQPDPGPVHHAGGHTADNHQGFMQLHLLGMWLTFAISALLICLLVIPLAGSVRQQQHLIARQREKMLQDEQLVALATFAASSAHKMGTPLSTLSVLVDDFRELVQGRPEWAQDRELMAQQIQLCKTILQEMMQRAEHLRHNVPQPIAVKALLQQVREQFNLLHPRFALKVMNPDIAGSVMADGTLEQALLNLLDNAVRAGDHCPVLRAMVEGAQLRLEIEDIGPGIPQRIQQQLGQPVVSSRKDGMGLGLFLSHATVERLGGTLSLHTREQSTEQDSQKPGTIIRVHLPLLGS